MPFCLLGSLLGQRTDVEEAAPSQSKIVLVQATGGIIAGATASCITTPLDTIKTRLQVFIYVVHVKLSSSIFISSFRTGLLDILWLCTRFGCAPIWYAVCVHDETQTIIICGGFWHIIELAQL